MDNLMLIGRWMVIAGIALAVTGGLVWLIAKIPGVGSLPGTIKFTTGGLTCVFPLLASIVLSIVLTVILNLLARWLNR